MQNERENLYKPLNMVEYDVEGNVFRAFYDVDGKLVFVLDLVVNDVKPNVLLVINPVGSRKWDDILMNDYAVDLETVRPKKDNRYQKLDIEYQGLGQYDKLIRAYQDDDEHAVALALVELIEFRHAAARRAAYERLGAADVVLTNAKETIDKTNETIAEHQLRLKTLRAKLATQRRDVGREPTKQSAAKILRTESQIDATNDKLMRSKKRLANAQRRLATAEDEVDFANDILTRLDEMDDAVANLPGMPLRTDVSMVDEPAVPMAVEPQFTEITTFQEPRVDDMADEEVKPLFDKDPEILDENIAFKPIQFDAISVPGENLIEPINNLPQEFVEQETVVQPLTFVPPVQMQPVVDEEKVDFVESAPVLNTLTTVELPSEKIDSELMGRMDAALPQVQAPVTAPEPAMPSTMEPVLPSAAPMPEISPAPIDTGMRPVSPITGSAQHTIAMEKRKPTVLYYVLLVVLIVLSIFTLWMYQKSVNTALPELGIDVKVVEQPEQTVPSEQESVLSPFVEEAKTEKIESSVVASVAPVIEEVVAMIDAEPAPVPVTPAEPVGVVQEEMVVVPVTPEPVVEVVSVEPETPFVSDDIVAAPATKSVADILASKPTYNVSQNEKMFVAAPEYETDIQMGYDEPTPAQFAVEVAPVEEVVEEVAETCADGAAPDADGCCAGEELVDFGGEYACCVIGTEKCFPPMF